MRVDAPRSSPKDKMLHLPDVRAGLEVESSWSAPESGVGSLEMSI
jgi:hypothetical protein